MGACQSSKSQNNNITAKTGENNEVKPVKATNHPGITTTTNYQPHDVQKAIIVEKPRDIHLLFSHNEKILFDGYFEQATCFIKVIEFIDSKFVKNKEREYEYLLCYGKALVDLHSNKNTTIAKLLTQKIEDNEVALKEEFTVLIRLIGLEICENVKQKLMSYTLLGKPLEETDPFEVVVYDKEINSLYSVHYSLHGDKKDLALFSNYSAYCNAKNKIYISGGETITKVADDIPSNKKIILQMFYCLDLKTGFVEKLKDLNIKRSWHSMIFIPENFIFLVGGMETKSVEYYDIEKGIFCKESDLNEERCETTLCCINNEYLYAFYGYNYINQNYSETIERMPLRLKTRTWEYVNFNNKDININSRFFGISLISDKEVIILGGQDICKDHKDVDFENKRYYNFCETAYIYNYDKNEISIYNQLINFEYFLGEKLFYPLSDNKFFFFPLNEPHLGLIFSENQIEQINYNEKDNKLFEQILDISRYTIKK